MRKRNIILVRAYDPTSQRFLVRWKQCTGFKTPQEFHEMVERINLDYKRKPKVEYCSGVPPVPDQIELLKRTT